MYKTFGLRQCTEQLQPSPEKQPCFYYQIKRCGAPCAMVQSHEEYANEVERARRFLSGTSGGLLEKLEEEMHAEAEALRFESATIIRNRLTELKRLFDRRAEVSTSVTHNNTIVLVEADSREKTVEVFFIKAGKLAHQEIIGRKSDIQHLQSLIETLYYAPNTLPIVDKVERMEPLEIDEIQIITSWIHRHTNHARILYVEHRELNEMHHEFMKAIRNTHNTSEAKYSEYNQIEFS